MKLNLKKIRKARGLTIDRFVEMSGLSKGFVSQLENGKRAPSAETLETIAQTFGIAVSDLVEDGGDAITRVQAAMRQMGEADQDRLAAMAEALAVQGQKAPS